MNYSEIATEIANQVAARLSTGSWTVTLAVVVSVMSLLVTVTWNVISTVINHRNSGPVVKVWTYVEVGLLDDADRIEAGLGATPVRSKVVMPARKWWRWKKRNPQPGAMKPTLIIVAVNVGRLPTKVAEIGIATKGRGAFSHPMEKLKLPADLAPAQEISWETPLATAVGQARTSGIRHFRGRVALTNRKVRTSRRLRFPKHDNQ